MEVVFLRERRRQSDSHRQRHFNKAWMERKRRECERQARKRRYTCNNKQLLHLENDRRRAGTRCAYLLSNKINPAFQNRVFNKAKTHESRLRRTKNSRGKDWVTEIMNNRDNIQLVESQWAIHVCTWRLFRDSLDKHKVAVLTPSLEHQRVSRLCWRVVWHQVRTPEWVCFLGL